MESNENRKYIDSEKLIAEIERLKDIYPSWQVKSAMDDLCDSITSLQQEQPEQTCKNCGFYENNCPFIRGKLIPYLNKVCNDYTYSAMKEQLKVDSEKEIDAVWNPRFNLGWDEYSCLTMNRAGFEHFARHFYELGLNARKEE